MAAGLRSPHLGQSTGRAAPGKVAGDDVRYRLLGPVEVQADGAVLAVPRRRQRAILAYLLLNHDQAISADRIAEAMWAGAGPSTARNQVQTELSRLRRLLRGGGAADPVTTTPYGYRIEVAAGELDLDEFTALVRRAAESTAGPEAINLLRSALDLWTGPALDGVTAAYAPPRRLLLEESLLRTYHQLFDRELAEGGHLRVTAELRALVAAHPLRESLTAQLVLALYRGGRQADALAAIRRLREALSEDGLEPSREMRELEVAVLRSDRALDVPDRPRRPDGAARSSRPMQAPRPLAAMIGRRAETGRLDQILGAPDAPRLAIITGTAGVGKTTLAVSWAHHAYARHPDGHLYANLHGYDAGARSLDPTDVLRRFLIALDEPAEHLPTEPDALAALYRTRMAGRNMLVILDNARDASQVRPLLPGSTGCGVLITSRDRMAGLVASEGAQLVPLDVFTEEEAREAMVSRLGWQRVADEPTAAAAVAAECARLPLAVAVVTARAAIRPAIPLTTIVAQLRGASGLEWFRLGDTASDIDINTAFSWSYETLSAPARDLFWAFGAHPVPATSIEAAASLCGMPVERARVAADELLRASLAAEQPGPRFGMHDLLRAYAQRAPSPGDPVAAIGRMLDHYLHSAHLAAILFQPRRAPLAMPPAADGVVIATMTDRHEAVEWLTAEHRTLVTLAGHAGAWGYDEHAWRLGWCLGDYLFRVGHWSDWLRVEEVALGAAQRLGDRVAVVAGHVALGRALHHLGRTSEAYPHLLSARRLSSVAGDRRREALALQVLADIAAVEGNHRDALTALNRALHLYTVSGSVLGAAAAHNNLALRYTDLGRYDDAQKHGEQALRDFGEGGEINGTGAAYDTLGRLHHCRGEYQAAIEHFVRSAEIKGTLGESYLEAMTLARLGDSYLAVGDTPAAARVWRTAAATLDRLRHPACAEVRGRMASLAGAAEAG
jgi:DNA-binding SARP family transcriptional activator/tetratricopeptide (TPR) repeat protein